MVVLVAPDAVDEAELSDWVRERIGLHKYPRRIHVRESLPTGPSGKVLKRVIVQELG